MKKIKVALLMTLLCGVQVTQPVLTKIDFLAFWLALSYVSRISYHWIDMQHGAKNQITPEDLKKLMNILQNNQLDIQDCKKNTKELYKRIDELAKKIRNKEIIYNGISNEMIIV